MIQSLLRRLGYAPVSLATERGVRVGYDSEPSGFAVISGSPENDYAQEWLFPDLIQTARRMMADSQISKEIRAIKLPLQKAEWAFEPASDDGKDVLIAEFCDAVFLGTETEHFGPEFWMLTPWKERLNNILRFLEFGFAHFCKTERQEGRFNIPNDLRYLLPESIDSSGLLFEDKSQPDVLTKLLRTYTDAQGKTHSREELTMDRVVWYTFDQEGGNILGRPLLRSMWKDWFYKDQYERLDMINAQKTKVGIPFAQARKDASPADKDNLEKLSRSMRGGNLERIHALITEGDDFGWKEGGEGDKGFRDSIASKNQGISTAGLSQFMELGTQDTGNRGIAGTKGAFASLMIGAIGDIVIEQEMKVVRDYVLRNFPNTKRFPMLTVSEVDPFEKTRSLPEAVTTIQAARNLGDVDLENQIRERYGLTEVDPDSIPEKPDVPDKPAPGNDGDGGEDPNQPDNNTSPKEPASSPATLSEEHPDAELLARARVNPDRIRNELSKYEDVYFAALRSVQSQMRDDVVRQVANGQLEPKAPKDVKISASLVQELKNRLKGTVLGARDFGRDELLAELRRQARNSRVVLASDPATRRGAVAFANQQAEVLVNVDVKALTDRLQAQATERYNQALLTSGDNPVAAAAELDAYLASITDQQLLEMARGSTATAFNLGRHIGMQEAATSISPYAVRTEILDDNTCEVCADYVRRAAAGEKFLINSREYFANLPPAGCEGRDKCRGFYVVEMLPEEKAA